MDPVGPARRSPRLRAETVVAVGLGVVLGVVVRDLPISVATRAIPVDQRGPCDDEAAIVECAIDAAPDVIGRVIMLGFVVLLVAVVGAVGGALLVAHGLRRSSPRALETHADDRAASVARSVVTLVHVMIGTALTVPLVWLLASFVRSL